MMLSIDKKSAGVKRVALTLFMWCLLVVCSYAQTKFEDAVQIPEALRITPGKIRQLPMIERQFMLSELAEGDRHEIFQAPPCMDGNFYVAIQLYHDLGNRNTQSLWSAAIEVSMLYNNVSLWRKPLVVSMKDQTLLSTAFHDNAVSCDQNYEIRIDKIQSNTSPEDNIYVRILLFRDDQEPFTTTASLALDVNPGTSQNSIRWTYDGPSVLEYDVEWVFVDAYSTPLSTPQQVFKTFEPVRISTAETYFNHSQVYPSGKLFYRVRPVGNDGNNRVYGDWVYSDGIVIKAPLEDLSWKTTTHYTGVGQYEKSVVYIDGEQKERQRIVAASDEKKSLASELLYDFEGRVALNVIPAPLKNNELTYQENLNQFNSVSPLVRKNVATGRAKFHYDNGALENSNFASTTGTSKYYSPSNENAKRDAFLPDAEGYVYKHITYANDAIHAGEIAETGKMLRTDGNHMSHKYYGAVGQEEAIRLFGAEGLSANLIKELVVDQDKKTTVRYLNKFDQCVAEANVGNSAMHSEPVTVNLLQGNRSEFVLLNAAAGTKYSFSYSLEQLSQEHLYDIELSVYLPSGLPLDLSTVAGNDSPNRKIFSKHHVTAADLSAIKFDLVFDAIGEYNISRKLTPVAIPVDDIINQTQGSDAFTKKSETLLNHQEYDSLACAACFSLATAEREALVKETVKQSVAVKIKNLYQVIERDYRVGHDIRESQAISEDSLKKHPLYAKYQYDVKNASSSEFDQAMTFIESWETAEERGLTNAVSLDPFFNSSSLSGYGFKEVMQAKTSEIVLATLVQGLDTIEYKGSLTEIVDPGNAAFYVNANGRPDAKGGIHPLYVDLLARRNKMTRDAFEKSVSEKRWQLYRNYYLQAKQEVMALIPEYKALSQTESSPAMALESPEVYAKNSIAVMEWAFNKRFAEQDKQSIEKDLSSYFRNGADNFLHVILQSDLQRQELVSVQSVLNKYGCDLNYISQNDKLGCVADDEMDLYQPTPIAEPTTVSARANTNNASESARQSTEQNNLEASENNTPVKNDSWTQQTMKSAVKHQGDYKALLSLYTKLKGSSWKNNAGWRQASEGGHSKSGFYGVITNAEGRVVALKLPDNNLNGAIPEEIGNLSELQYLDIGSLSNDGNKVTGQLPPSLGNLTKLVYLNVSNNRLTGDFPSSIYQLQNLKSLNLSGNNFTGSLSSDIEKVALLSNLSLSGNKLKGSIPTELGKLKNLKQLDLSRNEFANSIPASIGNLSQLTKLDLSSNKLSGDIPSTLGSLKNVQYVRLNNNSLQRGVPTSINSLKNVVQLDISSNNLSGNIPTLTSLSELKHLVMSNNKFTGSIPAEIASLSKIKSIDVSKNALEGNIPAALFESSSLEYLDLSSNMLTGEIPVAIGNSNKLQSVLLDDNKLTGNIPSEIGNNTTLAEFRVSHNELTGKLPATLASMTGLRVLQAGHNKLEGEIPDALGDMTNLEVLLLEANTLTDTIPSELANASRLTRIDLSENQLTGPIPTELGSISTLQELTLNNNKLSGQLPASLNRVPRVVVINNKLEGSIPVFASRGETTKNNAIWLSYNKYSFENILPLKDQTKLASFLYQKQDSIDDKKVVPLFIDHPFELIAHIDRNVVPPCHYQWFKYVDGVNDEALNSSSVEGHTLRLKTVTSFDDRSQYYYTITNEVVPGLTLVSNLQTVMPLSGNSLCVKFNPLNTFTINGSKEERISNWQAVLQKEHKALVQKEVAQALYTEANRLEHVKNGAKETFTVSYTPAEENYTLHYFDAVGNKIKTVKDNNVAILTRAQVDGIIRGEQKASRSINGVANDADLYVYNKLGQLRMRQYGDQRANHSFTYFRYDAQGREVEQGELIGNLSSNELHSKVENPNFPSEKDGDIVNVAMTKYDQDVDGKMRLARGKAIRKEFASTKKHKLSVTTIMYDENGYVKSTTQHDEGFEDKVTVYRHNPLSGKLTFQFYQNGAPDEFSQHYVYHASGKLKEVRSSTDGFIWNRDAAYSYYDHGALKQLKLGEFNVQSLDYYYTIQGWLKGINTSADNAMDATDAYTITLGYYNQDFKPISGRMETSLNPKESFTGEISWNTHDVNTHQKARQSNSIASLGANRKVYDTNGQLLASYVNEKVVTLPIYGINQIGIYIENNVLPGTRKLGAREFSLTNHKHEPLVVVSDNVSLNGKVAKPTVLTGSESQKTATGKSTEDSFTKAKN